MQTLSQQSKLTNEHRLGHIDIKSSQTFITFRCVAASLASACPMDSGIVCISVG